MTPTERQTKKDLITRIDGLIARMNDTKHQLIRELAEPDEPNKGDWYIQRDKNMYYQYLSTIGGVEVGLVRHQGLSRISLAQFNREFVKATPEDTTRHLKYLKSKNIPYVEKVVETKVSDINIHELKRNHGFGMSMADAIKHHLDNQPLRKGFDTSKCEFYMITVGNYDPLSKGAKIRHTTYEQAEREAIRLCEELNKEAFIVGVVASVKPVEERKVIVTVKPQVSKR